MSNNNMIILSTDQSFEQFTRLNFQYFDRRQDESSDYFINFPTCDSRQLPEKGEREVVNFISIHS